MDNYTYQKPAWTCTVVIAIARQKQGIQHGQQAKSTVGPCGHAQACTVVPRQKSCARPLAIQ
jgi:hypothetical protein